MWDEDQEEFPQWVYQALERLNPHLNVRNLEFRFWVPLEFEPLFKTWGAAVYELWHERQVMNVARLKSIMSHNKFRNVEFKLSLHSRTLHDTIVTVALD